VPQLLLHQPDIAAALVEQCRACRVPQIVQARDALVRLSLTPPPTRGAREAVDPDIAFILAEAAKLRAGQPPRSARGFNRGAGVVNRAMTPPLVSSPPRGAQPPRGYPMGLTAPSP
jgi:hypothetical protein